MKEQLDLNQLQRGLPSLEAQLALVAFARAGDVVSAAASLGVTQPALSFQLKRIESLMGMKLFATAGKRKVLTEVGRQLAEQTEQGLTRWRSQIQQIEERSQSLELQRLRIAGRRELLLPLLHLPFPGSIEWVSTSSAEAVEGLKAHRFHLAVSSKIPESADLVPKLLFTSRLKWIYPKAWGQASGQTGKSVRIRFEDCLSKPVIVYGLHHAYLNEALKSLGHPTYGLKVSRVVEDWFSVVEMVRYGLGWAVIPEAWEVHHPDVCEQLLPLDELLTQKIYLFYRREDRSSKWLKSVESKLKMK